MPLHNRLWKIIIASIAATGILALDLGAGPRMPRVAPAFADDDGGGRGGGRSDGRRGIDRDDDGPSLIRPWRKRKAASRRVARPAAVRAQYEPRMLVVRGLSETAIARLTGRGYIIVERHRLGNGTSILKLGVPPGQSLQSAHTELSAAEPRAIVDFNHYYRPEAEQCTGRRCLMRQISGWSMATATARCRPSAPIGLIDTRINVNHPSLAGTEITVLSLFEEPTDSSGEYHGTAVAALLVGKGDVPGLIQGWPLLAVDAFRKGDIATGYDLARAVDMLANRNVPVINMSLAGPDNAILAASVRDAAARGIVVVAAAGNDGPRAKPVFPAAYAEVIAVTAVDRTKKIYRRAVRGPHVDIAAPGVDVWTAASISGQKPRSGTSFAAPFVTAAAALILADNKGFGRQEVEIVLENEAYDLGDPGRDDTFGWGLLDVSGLCRG